MPDDGRIAPHRLVSALQRTPLTARRAALIIAIFTLAVTLAGGVVAWLTDRSDFPSLGAGLWWALQTVTTVGYGDLVPRDTGGRVIAAVVMLSGIGFLTVITAAVTAALVESARRRAAYPTATFRRSSTRSPRDWPRSRRGQAPPANPRKVPRASRSITRRG